MSRAAIYQLFRHIPDVDNAIIEAAMDALADQVATKADLDTQRAEIRADMAELRAEMQADIAELRAEMRAELAHIKEQMATKADLAELRSETRAGFRLLHWIIGILVALQLSMFWMLFGMAERLSAMETRLSAIETTLRAFGS